MSIGHHTSRKVLSVTEFEIRERFHVFILLLAPFLVFLGGLWLVLTPHHGSLAQLFLDSFGGLVLCVGAVFVYAVILVRRVLREAPLVLHEALLSNQLPPSEKIGRLAVFFLFFVLSWIAQAFFGVVGNVLFQSCMIVFGMLAVTLTAHFHAHQ